MRPRATGFGKTLARTDRSSPLFESLPAPAPRSGQLATARQHMWLTTTRPASRQPAGRTLLPAPRDTHRCDAAVLVRHHVARFLERVEEGSHGPLPDFVQAELRGFVV